VSERLYWPDGYVDEVVLDEGRRHPTAWLFRDDDGQVRLVPWDERHAGKAVKHGDEIKFAWSEPRPDVRITFHADGTYTVHGADAAPDANNFWDPGDTENSGDSLKFLAELVLDGDGWGMDLEREMTICCNVWQDETWRAVVTETDFRFERVTASIAPVVQGELRL
jgi:hypothetical protein